MERRIEIYPSWDKRSSEPKKNYGIHCCDISFFLVGKRGAYQFKAFTGWWLPHLRERCRDLTNYPRGFDIGYHAREPQYEGQEPLTEKCELLGGRCYYDGSSLQADPIAEAMVEGGSDAVWKALEERYVERFGALE